MTDDARRSHRRLRRVAWCVLLVTTAVGLLYAVFPSGESATERAQRLGSEIRSPDCQGLSAQDSDTRAATAIRVEVRRRVAAGESDERIRQGFVDRYGEFILLRPSTSGIGALVWA